MDPASLSLIAISASGVALRRYAELSNNEIPEFPGHRIDGRPRQSVIVRLKETKVTLRPLIDAGREAIAKRLARFASVRGLRLNAQVSLAALFSVEDAPDVEAELRRRRVDFVIADDAGLPVCGVTVVRGRGPSYRDSVCHQAFAAAGLPLVTMSLAASWAENRARLAAVVDSDPPAANIAAPVCIDDVQPLYA